MSTQNTSLCHHVAIIMDGNGRWAEERGCSRREGHCAGVQAVSRAIRFALASEEIKVLTLFALSIENNKLRPQKEVEALSALLLSALTENKSVLCKNNVRLRFIGERTGLLPELRAGLECAEKLTKENSGLTLVLAVNYSGKWDIAQAVSQFCSDKKVSHLAEASVVERAIQEHISCGDLPEPDLLIRTGGELRISNFMLWQMAYTELVFENIFWPDFDEAVFARAMGTFKKRKRRFGAVSKEK